MPPPDWSRSAADARRARASGLIEAILPSCVASAETRRLCGDHPLHWDESRLVDHAGEKRRREFAAGRKCARNAMAALGVTLAALPGGAHGEPLWPAGLVGSLTHCEGYCACAVARAGEIVAIGIDAEPNLPLPPGVELASIASPSECQGVAALQRAHSEVRWDKLLFSAKESVYKAWSGLSGERWLDFDHAAVTFDAPSRTFVAEVLVSTSAGTGHPLSAIAGSWASDGHVLVTAAVIW
jgi:4'-phosphopantetheinyl transferase EntD